jgi:mono/diheme cytochrome c family protein
MNPRRSLAALLALPLTLLPAAVSQAQRNDEQSFSLIARGRYLATLGDCTACHTASGGAFMAGGRKLPTPFGDLVSPNITPDPGTGIGNWSDQEFYNAMHIGVSDVHLYPAMPYPYYTKVTRDDVMAIRAWLNTVPPVHNAVHSDTLPFPFNVRAAMRGWDDLYFKPGTWQNQPGKSAAWNRGGYLVEGLGHCGACHTPKNVFGADDNSHHLQGYALQGWFAPDITSDKRIGIGAWSVDDIAEYLKNGVNQYTAASGPMAEEVADSTSHWSVDDLRAAATYLKDQPAPQETAPHPVAASDPAMQAGQAIYDDQCAACHTMGGTGIARMLPTLKGSPFVLQSNPASLLHVVLEGTRSVSTQGAPTGAAMPQFAWKLSDAQVADVVTYVRNAWGNAAPAVSPDQARSARKSMAPAGG